VGLYTPLQRNGADTTFIDAQALSNDSGGFELNLGTGYRYELSSGWTLGSYTYLDRFGSGPADTQQQVTLGVEALRANWTLRTGFAVGLSGPERSFADIHRARVELSGRDLAFRSSREIAPDKRSGTAEVGGRLPVFPASSSAQLRAFVGASRVAEADAAPRIGPRGSVELGLADFATLGRSSTLLIDSSLQQDGDGANEASAMVRWRLGL
jgi:hypothetical protein